MGGVETSPFVEELVTRLLDYLPVERFNRFCLELGNTRLVPLRFLGFFLFCFYFKKNCVC